MNLVRTRFSLGDIDAAGLRYEPDSRSMAPVCLLTHGFTASKESMDLLASYLAQRGFLAYTWDCRGHKLGATGGELLSMDQNLQDLHTVADAVQQESGPSRIVFIGHSMGAILSLSAAVSRPDSAALVAIATGPNPGAGFKTTGGAAMLAQRRTYVNGTDPHELFEGLGRIAHSVTSVNGLPACFVAARNDLVVRPDKMQAWAESLGESVSFIEVESLHQDAPARARGQIVNWLAKTLT